MAAAVTSSRLSTNNSPHLSSSSPVTRALPDSIPSIRKPDEESAPSKNGNSNNNSSGNHDAAPANAPLAPPPKPSTQTGDGDYFSGNHPASGPGPHSHFSKEPNPFEKEFGNPSETPGKPQLPGVTSLTSPASLLPANTPGWTSSLRSGPLSPAMLTGPANPDYFTTDHHFAGSFPTPNESSLRTGLTPGGGGSMFPQPSPNSQALYNTLQSGGATPGTLDFHQTAMTARAQTQANKYSTHPTTQPASQPPASHNIQPDLDSKPYRATNGASSQEDPFGSHQTTDAANGLFMLAQAGGQRGPQQPYQMPQQQQQQQQQPQQQQSQAQPFEKHATKASIGSAMSGSTEGAENYSDEESKPNSRNGRAKKASAGKATANGKRKTDESVGKVQPNKKQRGSNGIALSPELPDDDDMDDHDDLMSDKKMTDEEKRKNFLERNRVAALKCRQRKKQWLANLQQKVEIFSTENDALAATVTQLREEIVGLKTLLLAHKDCPVSQAQGISGMAMHQITGDAQSFANPYGMAMGHGGMAGPGQQGQMQRR